jgi:PhnB protein
MKKPAQPYLHFQDNCNEAMQFYRELFGGELDIMRIGESPAKEHFPEELYDQILHATLNNGAFNIMASDMCGQGDLMQGNSVELSLDCDSKEEIEHLYQKLSEGGQVVQQLAPQFWGSLFAMVIDRYGVRWMLSLEKP